MVPTHGAITDFEEELQTFATPFGGLNDGWAASPNPANTSNEMEPRTYPLFVFA